MANDYQITSIRDAYISIAKTLSMGDLIQSLFAREKNLEDRLLVSPDNASSMAAQLAEIQREIDTELKRIHKAAVHAIYRNR